MESFDIYCQSLIRINDIANTTPSLDFVLVWSYLFMINHNNVNNRVTTEWHSPSCILNIPLNTLSLYVNCNFFHSLTLTKSCKKLCLRACTITQDNVSSQYSQQIQAKKPCHTETSQDFTRIKLNLAFVPHNLIEIWLSKKLSALYLLSSVSTEVIIVGD